MISIRHTHLSYREPVGKAPVDPRYATSCHSPRGGGPDITPQSREISSAATHYLTTRDKRSCRSSPSPDGDKRELEMQPAPVHLKCRPSRRKTSTTKQSLGRAREITALGIWQCDVSCRNWLGA